MKPFFFRRFGETCPSHPKSHFSPTSALRVAPRSAAAKPPPGRAGPGLPPSKPPPTHSTGRHAPFVGGDRGFPGDSLTGHLGTLHARVDRSSRPPSHGATSGCRPSHPETEEGGRAAPERTACGSHPGMWGDGSAYAGPRVPSCVCRPDRDAHCGTSIGAHQAFVRQGRFPCSTRLRRLSSCGGRAPEWSRAISGAWWSVCGGGRGRQSRSGGTHGGPSSSEGRTRSSRRPRWGRRAKAGVRATSGKRGCSKRTSRRQAESISLVEGGRVNAEVPSRSVGNGATLGGRPPGQAHRRQVPASIAPTPLHAAAFPPRGGLAAPPHPSKPGRLFTKVACLLRSLHPATGGRGFSLFILCSGHLPTERLTDGEAAG